MGLVYNTIEGRISIVLQRRLPCEDGNGKNVFAKAIPFTDFPLPEIKLYVCDNVILLPSEY
jgi:hypothetical protein